MSRQGFNLPNWEFRLLPKDTRSIVASVFLGLALTVVLQIVERIDVAMTGGAIPLVAAFVVIFFLNAGALFYGLTGAMTVAWINPIVSNLTAASPLSPLFFLSNAARTVPIALMVRAVKQKHRGLNIVEYVIISQIGAILDAFVIAFGNRLILQLPWGFIWVQIGAMQAAAFVGALASFPLFARLLRTGMVEAPSAEARP